MRLLTFSTLYPNAARPTHGIFVETRLRHLLAAGQVQSTVMAPVPWFPFAQPRFGRYADYARTPREESRHAIRVLHPRYMLLPKIGMSSAPSLMSASLKHAIGKLIDRGGDFDLIDAHYFYPDGVAAVPVAAQDDPVGGAPCRRHHHRVRGAERRAGAARRARRARRGVAQRRGPADIPPGGPGCRARAPGCHRHDLALGRAVDTPQGTRSYDRRPADAAGCAPAHRRARPGGSEPEAAGRRHARGRPRKLHRRNTAGE